MDYSVAGSSRRGRGSAAGILAVAVLLAAYLFPTLIDLVTHKPIFAPLPSADTVPACLLPVSLLRQGDLYLDEYAGWIEANWGDQAYFVQQSHGHLVSVYPVLTPILATPVYALPVWMGWTADPGSTYYVARVAAAVLSVIAMGLFYLLCCEWLTPRRAAALTVTLGLGSGMWTSASQGLWQHTGSIPFLCGALLLLVRGESDERLLPWAGLLLSLATVARYNNATTLVILACFVLTKHRGAFIPFLVLASLPLAALLGCSLLVLGWPLALSYGSAATSGWTGTWWRGLAGLLVSPSKGLLVFSPFLLLAVIESARALRRVGTLLWFAALAAWAFTFTMSFWWAWYGGWSYGNRMLADSLPLWGMLMIPACSRLRRAGWAAVGGAGLFAAAAQALGLLDYGAGWHRAYDVGTASQAWLWDVKHSPIPFYIYHYYHSLLRLL